MPQFFGLYRAVVARSDDPLRQRRLLVQVPDVLGEATVWARACVPAGSRAVARVGTSVWVQFEAGNPNSPVWIGVFPGGT